MSNNLARLGVVMGLDTTEFQQNLASANKMMENFKDKLLELGTIAGFGELISKSMEFADSIVKTAKANDVTTASVLELSKALEENGGSAEETGRIYTGFNQKVETAALGSAKAQESFARLGVTLQDIAHLSAQDLFEKTIAGLAKINDSVTRNGIAFQVLGKGIRGVDIVGLAQTLEESRGKFDQYAESVNKAHELHLRLEASGRMVTLAFTQAFIPTLDALSKAFNDTAKESGGFVGFITDVINVLGVLFRYTTTVVVGLVDTLKLAGVELKNVLTGNFGAIVDTYKAYDDKIKAMVEADAKFSEDLLNPKKGGSEKSDQEIAVNREIINANAKKLGLAQNLSAEYKKHADLTLQEALQARDLLTLTKDQQSVQVAINKVINENQKAIDSIDKQIAAAKGTQGGGALIAEYEKQKASILSLRDTYIQSTKEEVQATIDFQRTFEFGWEKAFNQFKEDAGNNAKIAQDMFSSVLGSMNSAIDTFVTTGKLSFGDLAASILQDLEKIILKALLMKAITGMSGMMGTGTSSLFSITGFASGGDPPVGTPSIVGENGPELFIPKSSGTIIPNHQLSSVMNSSSGGVTYNGPYIANMSAIDTQSATQFLARNQVAVWSANQAAQRGLPSSR
jgi:lambda family phage tail tape measure protein